MKERQILFSDPMVRAILEGRKTQTRRVWKLPKWAEWDAIEGGEATGQLVPKDPAQRGWYSVDEVACPYGQPGDRLWVRETWCCVHGIPEAGVVPHPDDFVRYRADAGPGERVITDVKAWHPSIHMPRVYSRILLEIVSVRVERLNEISEKDAWAEGCEGFDDDVTGGKSGYSEFADLWQSINGPGSWEANPWVWVVEFRRI